MSDRQSSPHPRTPEDGRRDASDSVASVAMALARAAATGDVPSTTRLLELVAPRMMAVVRVVLGGNHPDADDVVQQSLIAFVQALPSFRGECEPPRFASRIAVRTAVAARRRVRERHARHDDLADLDMLASPPLAPGEDAFAERRKAIVRDLLSQLPEEQAESFALRIMLGWTLEEVAVATNAPLNTVRSRLRLAKEALRRRIEADPSLRESLEGES